MAEIPGNPVPTPTVEDEKPVADTFTLQVVSPSAGVSGPLFFTGLPFAATVKELKEKIRDEIAARPSNEHQRLIHRGRLLARENETMSEIFGTQTLNESPSQTLHLVLRPANTEPPPTQTIPSSTPLHNIPQPYTSGPSANPLPHAPFYQPAGPVYNGGDASHGMNATPQMGPATNDQIPGQNPGQTEAWNLVQQLQHNLQQMQHDHQHLQHSLQHSLLTRQIQQHLGALHQPPIPNVNVPTGSPSFTVPGSAQPVRTPSAPPSFNHPSTRHEQSRSPLRSNPTDLTNGQAPAQLGPQGLPQVNIPRPGQTSSWTREGTGPNGERYQVTVNQTTTFIPNDDILRGRGRPQPPPIGDFQNMLRMTNPAAQQGPQNSSGPNLTPIGLNGQTATANSISRPASAPLNGAPPPNMIPANLRHLGRVQAPNQGGLTPLSASSEPTVFLLSSPTGPRALVLANGQTYFSPNRPHTHLHDLTRRDVPPRHETSQVRNRREHHERHAHPQPQAHVEEDGAGLPAIGVAAHPGNPNAGAVAAQMWPHVWLIIRLLGFIWFFTSGNSSWWRWIMVSGLAFVFFLVNTGILNGFAEQVFGPIRRHLETLLPLAGPEGRAAVADNDPALPPAHGLPPQAGRAAGARGALDPAQVARRLLEQRRQADGNWVWMQLRRAEHAMLLFLASLVPGVGERHIAAREAEANALAEAERQRVQAANSAANTTEGGASGAAQDAVSGTSAQAEAEAVRENSGEGQEEAQAQAPEPLIEV